MRIRRTTRGIVAAVVCAVALAATGLASGGTAFGAISVPCSGPGGGAAGLVAAINTANARGGDTIVLANRCTYTLTQRNNGTDQDGNGLPVVTKPITIRGNGSTIARSSAQSTPFFRIFGVSSTGNLTLNELTLTGGSMETGGALETVGGTAKLVNSVVRDNAAGLGGGLSADNSGNLIVVTSKVQNNEAIQPGAGGGGGIVLSDHSTLSLLSSQVSNNQAPDSIGGGIHVREASRAEIRQSGVDENSAGAAGGIYLAATAGTGPTLLTMVGSHMRRNTAPDSGALEVSALYDADQPTNSFASKATIKSSDISDNVITVPDPNDDQLFAEGGAITNGGILELINTTVLRNVATGGSAFGGAILNQRQTLEPDPPGLQVLRIRDDSVIADNVAKGVQAFGGGIFNDERGTVVLQNSRVVRNSVQGNPADGGGIYNNDPLGGGITVTNTPIINNLPNNCAPPGTVPNCKG